MLYGYFVQFQIKKINTQFQMKIFLSKLIKENVHVSLVEGELSVKIPKKGIDPSIIEEIKNKKQDLIAYLEDLKRNDDINSTRIENIPESDHYLISNAQQRLWILNQFKDLAGSYNVFTRIELEGEHDIPAFKKAIFSVIDRHEILRTVFREVESGEVRQLVLNAKDFNFSIDYKDYRKLENPTKTAKLYIDNDSYKLFDLVNGPLLRASLFHLSDNKYIFYLNMHHIISDDWSLDVLYQDVMRFYEMYRTGVTPDFPKLEIQYKDYSAWQFNRLNGNDYQSIKEYWLDRLSGELPRVDLPSEKLRPKFQSSNGIQLSTFLSRETCDLMRKFIKIQQGSLFMLTLSVINILIYKYTSSKDILIGSPVAGRFHPDLEDQIGFYVNVLLLRNTISPTDDFIKFYNIVKENTIKDFECQEYPYDKLVEALALDYDTSRTSLYDISLTFHESNTNHKGKHKNDNGFDTIKEREFVASKNDIEFHLIPLGESISLEIIFNNDVYEIDMVKTMMKHFKSLMSSLLNNPRQTISNVEYLVEEEKQELLNTPDFSKIDYPKDITFVDCFLKQVQDTPNATALVFEEETMTYQELDEKSSHLAYYLIQKGVTKEDLVCICIKKRTEMIVGILAVLKSGGAYVPIDPNYPKERIDFILEDTNSNIILSASDLKEVVQEYSSKEIIYVDESSDIMFNTTLGFPEIQIESNNLAYVIYTSGSTGKPKGVKIEHSALMNFLFSMRDFLGLDQNIKFLSLTTFTFDISILEFLAPLILGGRVILVNDVDSRNPNYIKKIVKSKKPTCIQATPSHWQLLIDSDWNIDKNTVLLSGGEAISEELKEKITSLSNRTWNLYGPTETTIWSCISKLEKDRKVTIGGPIANTQIYILDEYLSLIPRGSVGEICIGGSGLSRGYLNQNQLTQEKFIKFPFKKGVRIYRTGDLGRWLPDGTIEFIGRKDNQVKIRGYRIELGEIESVLLNKEEIKTAVIVAKKSTSGDKDLVAYYNSTIDLDLVELRQYLQERLPSYMVPNYFVAIDEMPLTANGKINRKALPDHEGIELDSGLEYIPARNETEKKLVSIWEKVLGRDRVGIKDDFFDLGGHSLRVIRLINEYHKIFDVKLEVQDIFSNTKLEQHVGLLSSSKKNHHLLIPVLKKESSYPISDAQRRLWVLNQFKGGNVSYNMPSSVLLDGHFDLFNFKQAIKSVLDRHEVLRTVFREDSNGIIRQVILDTEEIQFEIGYEDYRHEEDPEQKAKLYLEEDSYKPFNLETGPLLRFSLLQISDSDNIFYFNIHHIISDGWSIEVLSRDVLAYYEYYSAGVSLELPKLRIQYKDYASWQLANLETDEYKTHRDYWLSKFSENIPVIDLPTDKKRPLMRTYNGRHISTYLDKENSSLIRNYVDQNEGTLFMFLLASLKVLLYRYTGEENIVIGSPIAGRDHSELEDQIGFYVNTLALRNTINGSTSFDEFYNQVKQELLDAYTHQMYPFDRLVEELDLKRDTGRNPLFDILVVLQNKIDDNIVKDTKEDIKSIIDHGEVPSNFDIEFNFNEIGDNIRLDLTYNEDVYDNKIITDLIIHYQNLIKALVLEKETCINELNYLQDSERNLLLYDFNNTSVEYEKNKTILDVFNEQVDKTPNAIAIVFEDVKITYKEIDELSNKLANYLLSAHTIKIGDIVGVKLERNEWQIISLLSVLKTGAAYVPINPNYPEERIDYIENDSNCKVTIDEFVIEVFRSSQNISKERPKVEISTDNLAYVMYTSGSTGQPKGVMVTHKNVFNLLYWFTDNFKISEKTVAIQLTDISFDPSIEDIFGTFIKGGVYHIISKNVLSNIQELREYIFKNKITILNYIPRYLFELLGNQPKIDSIEFVISGGEKLQEDNKLAILDAGYELYNNYGPTETTVDVLCGKMNEKSSYIGKPIYNTKIYVLDSNKQIVPVGFSGELCVSGKGLSKGYLNQPELTNDRFIQNPFDQDQKLYLTGDIVQWSSNGNIIFIGRKDDQVKVRGYRIELTEIEKKLSSQKNIDDAIVLIKEEDNNEKFIVAFLIGDTIEIGQVKLALRKQLPDYMIPSYFKVIDHIPLNSNGKIDKNELLTKEIFIEQKTYVPPSNEIEIKLVNIWERILEVEEIGVNDNFFELGGHSIKGIKIISEVQKEFGVKVEISKLFLNPTILEMAKEISEWNWTNSELSEEEIVDKITI